MTRTNQWSRWRVDIGLKHGGKFFSVYGHLSKVVVVIGQRIKRGQLIGFSWKSNTYLSTPAFWASQIGQKR